VADRWELRSVTDNRGKPLSVWLWWDYELCENVNLGNEGGWMFELTKDGERVALYPTLKDGKLGALEHRNRRDDTADSPELLEVAS